MEITIEKTVKVQEKITLTTPTFYRVKYGGFVGIYSKDKVVRLYITSGYASATCGPFKDVSGMDTLEEEIPETVFNELLAQALFLIAGVEVDVIPQLQTA